MYSIYVTMANIMQPFRNSSFISLPLENGGPLPVSVAGTVCLVKQPFFRATSNSSSALETSPFFLLPDGYVSFSTSNVQISTWLVSGAVDPGVVSCLGFWFAVKGEDEGSGLAVKRLGELGKGFFRG